MGDGGHDIDFDGDGAVLRMSLPAVGKDARLDHLLDDNGGLHLGLARIRNGVRCTYTK